MLPPLVWLVLGCHRSGTSLFSSILNGLGGNLPSNLLRPSLTNIRGFNESWHWVQTNDLILKRMGLTWDSIVPTTKCIESQSFVDSQKKYVAKAFLRGFPKNGQLEGPLIIKDPRICRTFPVWERALIELDSNIKIFLPVRHPFEVIQSLVSRDGFKPQKACYIWIWNLIEALIFTKKHNPEIIIYDKLILNPTNYLSDVFGTNLPVNINQKIDSKLNHNKLARNLFPVTKEPFRTAIDLYDQIYNLRKPSNNLVLFCEKIRYHSQFVGDFEKRILNKNIKGLFNNRSREKKSEIACEPLVPKHSWSKSSFALKNKFLKILNIHEKYQ